LPYEAVTDFAEAFTRSIRPDDFVPSNLGYLELYKLYILFVIQTKHWQGIYTYMYPGSPSARPPLTADTPLRAASLSTVDKTQLIKSYIRSQREYHPHHVAEGKKVYESWNACPTQTPRVALGPSANPESSFRTAASHRSQISAEKPVGKPTRRQKRIDPAMGSAGQPHSEDKKFAIANYHKPPPLMQDNLNRYISSTKQPRPAKSNAPKKRARSPDADREAIFSERRERRRSKKAIVEQERALFVSDDSELDGRVAAGEKSNGRQSKGKGKNINLSAGLALMHGFSAENVGPNRLTLKPSFGVFQKGKASLKAKTKPKAPEKHKSGNAWSEMGFLNTSHLNQIQQLEPPIAEGPAALYLEKDGLNEEGNPEAIHPRCLGGSQPSIVSGDPVYSEMGFLPDTFYVATSSIDHEPYMPILNQTRSPTLAADTITYDRGRQQDDSSDCNDEPYVYSDGHGVAYSIRNQEMAYPCGILSNSAHFIGGSANTYRHDNVDSVFGRYPDEDLLCSQGPIYAEQFSTQNTEPKMDVDAQDFGDEIRASRQDIGDSSVPEDCNSSAGGPTWEFDQPIAGYTLDIDVDSISSTTGAGDLSRSAYGDLEGGYFYQSEDDITYVPEDALKQGLGMVKSMKHNIKRLELGSKLRKDVWLREIESLQGQGAPTTMIAICGATGAGKSSILNAILDDNIVPTSGMRACTAVVTEIGYHPKKTIDADVSFLSEAEWRQELAVLLDDLVDEDGKLKRSTDLRSDAGVAWQKVRAVNLIILQHAHKSN
ncbi:hypothetical protein EW026_g8299, partial [Hermanssonia centrifuga]